MAAPVAHGQPQTLTPLLGEVFPSGSVYVLLPDEVGVGTGFWPDRVHLWGIDGSGGEEADLAQVLRNVDIPLREGFTAACAPQTDAEKASMSDDDGKGSPVLFGRGMPDNCEVDARVGLFVVQDPAQIAPGGSRFVIGLSPSPGNLTVLPGTGALRPLAADEHAVVAAQRDGFLTGYRTAFGAEYSADTSPIGEIATLADAVVLAEFTAAGLTIRLSHWERITPTQHIYQHYIVDLIRDGQPPEQVEFSRFQGVLG